ncbi:MAG: hypothetical protein R6W96_01755 [Clostridia bacterium]
MKKLTMIILTFLFIVSLFGCTSPQKNNLTDGNNTSPGIDSGSENLLGKYFEGYAAAATVLPEPWMAYPDSIVDIDWIQRGMTAIPAWTLVAPSGTTREDVVDYYIMMANQRDDFETVETYHGIAGIWAWNGVNITIEPDSHYAYPELVQIGFWFQEDYRK